MYVATFLGPGPGITPSDEIPIIDFCSELAIAAADAGFSLVTFGEQHFNGYEPYCNPFMMGARVAPYMKDTYLGTTVCPLPFNHPLRLAENINVLDVLTRGKAIAGLSAGRAANAPGMASDFDTFAVDPNQREAIFESRIELMLKAWAHRRDEPPLVYETEWDKGMVRGQLMPMSFREDKPLTAIGANADSSVRRAASLRWPVFLGPCPREEAVAKYALYRETLEAGGASAEEITRLTDLSLVARAVIVGETEEAAWALAEELLGGLIPRRGDTRTLRELREIPLDSAEAKADPLFPAIRFVHSGLNVGTPDSVTEQLLFYSRNGIEQVHLRFPVGSPFRPETVWPSFRLFVDEVMPRLSPRTFPAPAQRVIVETARSGVAMPMGAPGTPGQGRPPGAPAGR